MTLTSPSVESIRYFEQRHLISPELADAAVAADASGTDDHTIGYEVEILGAYRDDNDTLRGLRGLTGYDARNRCRNDLDGSGFNVELDGLYELISPYARHPHALGVATRGLVNTGWLPETPTGVITAHISIGTTVGYDNLISERARLTRMLRAIELSGYSHPLRLRRPLSDIEESGGCVDSLVATWAGKGHAGVLLDACPDTSNSYWVGDYRRVELRTPLYAGYERFTDALNLTYALSRGILDKDPAVQGHYDGFEEWFRQFMFENKLPDRTGKQLREIVNKKAGGFGKYILPFVEYLENGDRSLVSEQAHKAAAAILAEVGMSISPASNSLP